MADVAAIEDASIVCLLLQVFVCPHLERSIHYIGIDLLAMVGWALLLRASMLMGSRGIKISMHAVAEARLDYWPHCFGWLLYGQHLPMCCSCRATNMQTSQYGEC